MHATLTKRGQTTWPTAERKHFSLLRKIFFLQNTHFTSKIGVTCQSRRKGGYDGNARTPLSHKLSRSTFLLRQQNPSWSSTLSNIHSSLFAAWPVFISCCLRNARNAVSDNLIFQISRWRVPPDPPWIVLSRKTECPRACMCHAIYDYNKLREEWESTSQTALSLTMFAMYKSLKSWMQSSSWHQIENVTVPSYDNSPVVFKLGTCKLPKRVVSVLTESPGGPLICRIKPKGPLESWERI